MTKKWLGSQENCDICEGKLNEFDTFYDARLTGRTQWALMCKECFDKFAVGLGTGLGQEYNSTTKEKIRG